MKKLAVCTLALTMIVVFLITAFSGCSAIEDAMTGARIDRLLGRNASDGNTQNNDGDASASLTPTQIFENNADAVFTIYTSFDNDYFQSMGSGFFLCSTGIAVTNHHVITGWPYAIIRTHSGREFDISGYYSYYISDDLAIIQVDGRRFPYLTMADSRSVRVGDSIYTIGSPLGYHNTFSAGMVSGLDIMSEFGIYRIHGMIQFTAPISGGSSGGALLNDAGHVIGITTAAYDAVFAQALNFAVPIARVDLASAEGRYSQLPIGEILSVDASSVEGLWFWSGGTYDFNADGSGERVWDGVFAEFQWHMSGPMLVLDLGDDEERWFVDVINEDEITIGGAWFTRIDAMTDYEIHIIGAWDWHGGSYVFNPDGSGERVWDGVFAAFQWDAINSMIYLNITGARDEQWAVDIGNENRMTIGGARFTRANSPATSTTQLVGEWLWSGGTYTLNADGTGSRVWDNIPASFRWNIEGGVLVLSIPGGEERWAVNVINGDSVTVGGALFARVD